MKITNPSQLKREVINAGNEPYFFAPKTMRYFGDTMRNYGVRKPVEIETNLGEIVKAYELFRKRPVRGGRTESSWFHADSFKCVYPKG